MTFQELNKLSVKELLNVDMSDIMKLSRSEAARITSKLVSAANKRINRLEKAGIKSTPAIADTSFRFSVKGQNLNQLRGVFVATKNFLNNKTSSLSGYKKFLKEFKELKGEEYEDFINNPEDSSNFFRLLDEVKEINPSLYRIKYNEIWEKATELEGEDKEESTRKMLEFLEEQYVEQWESIDYGDEIFF